MVAVNSCEIFLLFFKIVYLKGFWLWYIIETYMEMPVANQEYKGVYVKQQSIAITLSGYKHHLLNTLFQDIAWLTTWLPVLPKLNETKLKLEQNSGSVPRGTTYLLQETTEWEIYRKLKLFQSNTHKGSSTKYFPHRNWNKDSR